MKPLATGVVACALFVGSTAHADPPSPSATYEVHFDDDDLLAPSLSAYGEWLKGTHKPQRALLIRPRTSFVPELLTSVQKHF